MCAVVLCARRIYFFNLFDSQILSTRDILFNLLRKFDFIIVREKSLCLHQFFVRSVGTGIRTRNFSRARRVLSQLSYSSRPTTLPLLVYIFYVFPYSSRYEFKPESLGFPRPIRNSINAIHLPRPKQLTISLRSHYLLLQRYSRAQPATPILQHFLLQ